MMVFLMMRKRKTRLRLKTMTKCIGLIAETLSSCSHSGERPSPYSPQSSINRGRRQNGPGTTLRFERGSAEAR